MITRFSGELIPEKCFHEVFTEISQHEKLQKKDPKNDPKHRRAQEWEFKETSYFEAVFSYFLDGTYSRTSFSLFEAEGPKPIFQRLSGLQNDSWKAKM